MPRNSVQCQLCCDVTWHGFYLYNNVIGISFFVQPYNYMSEYWLLSHASELGSPAKITPDQPTDVVVVVGYSWQRVILPPRLNAPFLNVPPFFKIGYENTYLERTWHITILRTPLDIAAQRWSLYQGSILSHCWRWSDSHFRLEGVTAKFPPKGGS